MTDDCNIDSCSILKKPKLILEKFSRKYDKNNTFIFANLCPKISKSGRWEKRWQNLCTNYFNLHDTNHLFPINIALKPWQMTNEHTINRIVHKIFEGIDSFSKLMIVFEIFKQ